MTFTSPLSLRLKPALPLLLIPIVSVLAGCSGDRISALSNSDSKDNTTTTVDQTGSLLSAFYGLDDAIPFLASYRICGSFGHKDGMPVIFSEEVDISTLQAGDLLVTLADGQTVTPGCVTPAPAEDPGEFRTILTIGDFGSINNQPVMVEVVGHVLSLDQELNFKGSRVAVTPLEDGPTLIHAELVDEAQWNLGGEATSLSFGGGNGCPSGTRQVIRVVWTGGVTKPGGDEVDATERDAYQINVANPDGSLSVITPFAIADLGDGDNNHELCLDQTTQPVSVEFPEGLMTDPREDLNPQTSVAL